MQIARAHCIKTAEQQAPPAPWLLFFWPRLMTETAAADRSWRAVAAACRGANESKTENSPWCWSDTVQVGSRGAFKGRHLPPTCAQAQGRFPLPHFFATAGAAVAHCRAHRPSSARATKVLVRMVVMLMRCLLC